MKTQNKINTKKTMSRNINSFLLVFQRQSKNLTSTQIKEDSFISFLPPQTWEQVNNVILKALKENNYQPKIIYITKILQMEVKEKYLYKKCLLSAYYVSGTILGVQQ